MSNQPRFQAALALGVLVAAVLAGTRTLWSSSDWFGPFEWVVSAELLLAGMLTPVAIRLGWKNISIAIPAFLLVTNTVFILGRFFHWDPIGIATLSSDRFVLVLSSGTVLGVIGLFWRRQWARWLCLAFGVAGLGCGVINALNYWEASGTPYLDNLEWYQRVCRTEWVYLVTATGGALIVLNLTATRREFIAHKVWNRDEPAIRWLRRTLIASFVSIPMLLVYAWVQPVVPATVTSALVLAVMLLLGSILAVRGNVLGALLLIAAGAGLLIQTAVTAFYAGTNLPIAGYYAAFWGPSGIVSIICGSFLVPSILRFLGASASEPTRSGDHVRNVAHE